MALITCKDCKKDFSTDAKRCPHCGAKKPASKILKYSLSVLVLLLVVSQCEGNRLIKEAEKRKAASTAIIPIPAAPSVTPPTPTPQAAAAPTPAPIALKEYQRCKATEKMVDTLLEQQITYCWLAPDPEAPQRKMMVIVSTLPAFSNEAARRGWMLSVMGAAGYLMHEKKTPLTSIVMADYQMVESRQALRFDAPALSKLRQKLFHNTMDGMEVYNQLNALATPIPLNDYLAAPILAKQAEDKLLGDAQYACKTFVKKTLHDPDSAQFENHKSYPASVTDGVYRVMVQVRAKNGFNAMRNITMDCKTAHKDGNWIALNLKQLN